MRISDWSSDVCSSHLLVGQGKSSSVSQAASADRHSGTAPVEEEATKHRDEHQELRAHRLQGREDSEHGDADAAAKRRDIDDARSEEHTSELQSLMRISYAVFCLKKTTYH